jgi:hypothetical protein
MKSLALPTALPEEIGLSSARLDRLTQVMRDEVARGRVQRAYYRMLFRDMVYAAFAD